MPKLERNLLCRRGKKFFRIRKQGHESLLFLLKIQRIHFVKEQNQRYGFTNSRSCGIVQSYFLVHTLTPDSPDALRTASLTISKRAKRSKKLPSNSEAIRHRKPHTPHDKANSRPKLWYNSSAVFRL